MRSFGFSGRKPLTHQLISFGDREAEGGRDSVSLSLGTLPLFALFPFLLIVLVFSV